MSRLPNPSKTKTAHSNSVQSSNIAIVFVGTFAGVVFGVLLSVGFMKPMLQSAVASATKDLHSQTLALAPASDFTSCTVPTSASGGQELGASTSMAPSGTMPGGKGGGGSENGGSGGTKTVFVHKLVSGIWANTTASNSNTGPDSRNVIVTKNTNTTTVTNTNDVSVNNSNDQSSTSGDASSHNNTTGGNTSSGTASNRNDADINVGITN